MSIGGLGQSGHRVRSNKFSVGGNAEVETRPVKFFSSFKKETKMKKKLTIFINCL